MKKFYQNKNFISVALSVVLTFAFVVVAVDAATTISTNINTAGTLTVTGNHVLIGTTTQSGLSVLTLEATSTAAIPLTLRGYDSQTADLFRAHDVGGTELFAIDFAGNASTTMISTTGNIWVNGYATTTSAGNINIEGTMGIASSTPAEEFGITGDIYAGSAATTTVHVKSTGSSIGGCIEMEGADDTIYRIYINTVGNAVKVEAGTCQ